MCETTTLSKKYKIKLIWSGFTYYATNGYFEVEIPTIEGYTISPYNSFVSIVATGTGDAVIPYRIAASGNGKFQIYLHFPYKTNPTDINVYAGLVLFYLKN